MPGCINFFMFLIVQQLNICHNSFDSILVVEGIRIYCAILSVLSYYCYRFYYFNVVIPTIFSIVLLMIDTNCVLLID